MTRWTWCHVALLLALTTDASMAAPSSLPQTACAHFPAGTFADPGSGLNFDEDSFSRRWYSSALGAMTEPSLSCETYPKEEVYRFLWLRSFHRPIAVRVERSGRRHRLYAVVTDGMGGYSPGVVTRRVERNLSQEEWRGLVRILREVQFWTLPTEPHMDASDEYIELHVDGAHWIIEGRNGETYHVVDRWSGEDGLEEAGLTFLRLAGLIPPRREIY